MKEAIQKAIEGGWRSQILVNQDKDLSITTARLSMYVLDPLFWSSLGKTLGWEDEKFYSHDGIHATGETMSEAQWHSRCFWNHIWEGKDIDSFFEELLHD